MIVGIGIDMIEVHRVMDKVNKDNGFLEKVFSFNEIQFCKANRLAENYAARLLPRKPF
jgi:holo-[acyl-carrier protein] synthase